MDENEHFSNQIFLYKCEVFDAGLGRNQTNSCLERSLNIEMYPY